MFDINDLQQFLDKWQKLLRLKDWDIKLELVTKEWRKTGDVKIDQADKVAILMINTFNPKQTNIETVIIHELLHIKLWGMDQMIESLLHCVYGNKENDPKFSFLKNEGMKILSEQLGLVRAERFISMINREPFDYTEWQRSLYKDIPLDDFLNKAMDFRLSKGVVNE